MSPAYSHTVVKGLSGEVQKQLNSVMRYANELLNDDSLNLTDQQQDKIKCLLKSAQATAESLANLIAGVAEPTLDQSLSYQKEEFSFHDEDCCQNIIASSEQMYRLFNLINRLSSSEADVLIQGESGTGKELVARAIHFSSLRKDTKFIPVSCAAFAPGVIESELFGHLKGSFTSAHRDKKGLFQLANNGTIFLDEISEIPLALQVKLLRAIQEGEVTPVGSEKMEKVDVRIIAASNRDLKEEVRQGKFREDLFYRLNVVSLRIPPLRERRADIPLLVEHFVQKFQPETRKINSVEPRVMKILYQYDWPGNVRELENAIRGAIAIGKGQIITLDDLTSAASSLMENHCPVDKNLSVDEYEKMIIEKAVRTNKDDYKHAAKSLNMSLATLYRKIKKYKIERGQL
ncbi:MAG: sigma-54 dependent transcriptional regulator [Pseudomonadota bacterium]